MASFTSSRYCALIAGIWGLCEGTFFFIVPDVVTALVALFRFRAGLTVVAATIVGSLVSAIVMYLLVATLGESAMMRFIGAVPFVSDQMISDVSERLDESGLAALILAPWEGLPYKIYSVEASAEDISLWPYLLWSIPSRLERVLPVPLAAGALGVLFRGSIVKHTPMWLVAYLAIWILLYAFYWFVT